MLLTAPKSPTKQLALATFAHALSLQTQDLLQLLETASSALDHSTKGAAPINVPDIVWSIKVPMVSGRVNRKCWFVNKKGVKWSWGSLRFRAWECNVFSLRILLTSSSRNVFVLRIMSSKLPSNANLAS